MATQAVTRRLDLTDEQWARLEPLLPVPTRSGRPPAWTKRQLIDGIRWRVRVGAPWRDVPDCYGSWRAVYALSRRWQRAGAWRRSSRPANPGGRGRTDHLGRQVDSTIARAHQHAAGARRHPSQQQEPPGGLSIEPEDHALGRSRGGLTTKIHLACEQGQKVLSLIVTAGQRGDSPQFRAVLDGINVPRIGAGRPRTRPDKARADKAYSSRANRAYLRRRGIACTIPEPADQQHHRKNRGRRGGRPPRFSPDDYRARHGHAVAHLATEHPQVRTWPDVSPDLAHQLDHRDWIDDHHHRSAERAAEQAFERLNPGFGVPTDRTDRIGHHDLAQRERALSLGVRVAVHDSTQNDPNPGIWQPGQDYRMADALQAARAQPTRTRWGPGRLGPER